MDKYKKMREEFIESALKEIKFATRHRCSRCDRVDFCIPNCTTRECLCLVCIAQTRFPDTPKLDVDDFSRL